MSPVVEPSNPLLLIMDAILRIVISVQTIAGPSEKLVHGDKAPRNKQEPGERLSCMVELSMLSDCSLRTYCSKKPVLRALDPV